MRQMGKRGPYGNKRLITIYPKKHMVSIRLKHASLCCYQTRIHGHFKFIGCFQRGKPIVHNASNQRRAFVLQRLGLAGGLSDARPSPSSPHSGNPGNPPDQLILP